MLDVGNLNPDRESRSGEVERSGNLGKTRKRFYRTFGYTNKEHPEPTEASSSQSTDHMMSTPEDKTVPFTKDQIKALIEGFKPIKEQIKTLKGKINKMSPENLEQILENQNQAQELVKQLMQIDRAGDFDRTIDSKQTSLTGDICTDTFNALKYLYAKYILKLTDATKNVNAVTLGENARREFKRLLEDTMECWARLVAPLCDAQVKIWEGTWSEDTIANLMRTSEVVSLETLRGGPKFIQRARKVTLSCGLSGVWKAVKDDFFLSDLNPESELYPPWYKYDRGPAFKAISEIAAYQVDKLLGLNIVPLTVEREINGEKGSLQIWMDNMKNNSNKLGFRIIDNVKLFCALIAKNDLYEENREKDGRFRNCGFIGKGSDRRAVLFDNEEAFNSYSGQTFNNFINSFDRSLSQKLCEKDLIQLLDQFYTRSVFESSRTASQLTKSVLEKARQLNMDQLEHIQYLDERQKENLLLRRDKLIQVIDGLRPSED